MTQGAGFTGGTIDRADHLRNDPEALAALTGDWRSRLLGMDGIDPRIDASGGLVWTSLAEAADDDALIFLGQDEGRARFAPLPATPIRMNPANRAIWPVIEALPAADAAIYGTARSLIDWHGRHRFCAACGAPTDFWRGGWGRQCPACGAEHFPRVDPVVIMLAEHDGRVLVGRGATWPKGRYSALAGFVEPGEAIEEAVARELFEEAGVRVTAVRYVASQPWPFPSSLMIAAIAKVDSDALTLAAQELEHAFWATRDDVVAALAHAPDARFDGPPRFAIAHTLFRAWLDESAD